METVAEASFVEHGHVRQPVEECEHGMRQRRTYREVAGTPGYQIIAAAGLKPFAELTETQRKQLASREEQRAREGRLWAPSLPTDVLPGGPSRRGGPMSGLRG